MSDLLEKFAGIVEQKQGGAWHGEESIPVRLSEEEMHEIITALQALRDLETIATEDDEVTLTRVCASRWCVTAISEDFSSDTIPAALRAAVEAINKGETE